MGSLLGVDGAQSINLVHVYDDQILHSVVPVNETREVSGFPDSVLDKLAQLSHEERIAAFSPGLLVVSYGADTYAGDPISHFRLQAPDCQRRSQRRAQAAQARTP